MKGRFIIIPDGPAAPSYSLPFLTALRDAGATVKVAPTAYDGTSAAELVTPLAWSMVSGHPCLEIDRLDSDALQWAEAIILAPATPLLERVFRHGNGAALLRTANRPALVIGATTQTTDTELVTALQEWQGELPVGSLVLPPEANRISLGAMGSLAVAPIQTAVEAASRMVTRQDLRGKHLLVSAGPTVEDIDPVRFISNRSSGKMGAALALAAWRRGAEVTLVHGPVSLQIPKLPGLRLLPVRSAAQMHDAMAENWNGCDAAIFSAAVADFTPDHYCDEKIKKIDGQSLILHLLRTKDILGELGAAANRPRCLVGFAAESDDVEINALAKLRKKHCDLICANDIRKPGSGFATDTNAVTIYDSDGKTTELPTLPKAEVADKIIDQIVSKLDAKNH